ncbi:MAG: hypothetical protein WCS69_04355 [Ignavibacteriaceae bacterium]|jgi:hypothetical protein
MNTREKNKHEMLGTVTGFYETEKSTFADLPGLISAFSDVIAINKEIDLNEKVVQEGTKGKVVSRDDSQSELIKIALVCAGAIYGYAAAENDLELLTFADVSSSTFKKMRDAEIPLKVEKILDKGDELGAALIPFGLSEEKRTTGRASLDDYMEKFGSVNTGKGNKKSAAESSKKLLVKVDQKLKVLDKLMLNFKEEKPDLYSRYSMARIIYDKRGSRRGGNGETPPPPEEPK